MYVKCTDKQSVETSSVCRLMPPENGFRLTFVIQTKRFDDSFFQRRSQFRFCVRFFPYKLLFHVWFLCWGPIERRLCSSQSEFVSSESTEFIHKIYYLSNQYACRTLHEARYCSFRVYTRLINSSHISEKFVPSIFQPINIHEIKKVARWD